MKTRFFKVVLNICSFNCRKDDNIELVKEFQLVHQFANIDDIEMFF